MNVLFIHQTFPGQFKNVARLLASDPDNDVRFVSRPNANEIPGVGKHAYVPSRENAGQAHLYVRDLERGVVNGQAVALKINDIVASGFRPDLVVGHNGWGETLFVKDVLPSVPLLSYFEFFYRPTGADTSFDPEFPTTFDDQLRIRIKNATNLVGLEAADWGITPTKWQHSLYPDWARRKISILHEGIDTKRVAPDPAAVFVLPTGQRLSRGAKLVTYVARNLEPYRGIHTFVRALTRILADPEVIVVVVGGTAVSYGRGPSGEASHLARRMQDMTLDWSRVWFLGQISYADYLALLQVSAAHVYLTYPFVLSWSLLEAMAAGCLVVGSATAPVEEVIQHRRNGLLVDFFSPDDLADQVGWALDNPSAGLRLRERARATIVDRYDFMTCIRPQVDKLFAQLTSRAPRRARSGRGTADVKGRLSVTAAQK
jgi:glycosyltransferase involved in cell wall biosynthesis